MATSPELKAAAQDERDSLKDVRASADVTIAAVAAAAILVSPPFGLLGLIPAVIRWRAMKELTVQERLIEDPPRPDFEIPAEPDFETFVPDPSDWARPLNAYVETSVEICAFEEAMVSSIEKSLGAQDQGASSHSKRRAREASAFAEQTRSALTRNAENQWLLANLVNSGELAEASARLRASGPWERPDTPLQALPDATALWLFRAGVPPSAFLSWEGGASPNHHTFHRFWGDLYENGVSKRRLAEQLVL